MDLKTIVVDDEQLARDELGYLLGQVGGVEIIAQAGNGVEALETIDRLQPDLVFLDVQMPGLTGFEVARRLLVVNDDGLQIHQAVTFSGTASSGISTLAHVPRPTSLVSLSW